MISRTEMKIDLIGQSVLLLLAVMLLVFNSEQLETGTWGLGLLLIWQMGSAAFYWRQYKYRERRPVFWILLLFFAFIWFINFSTIALLIFGIAVLGYLFLTLRDTLRVYRRPRSFWDLG